MKIFIYLSTLITVIIPTAKCSKILGIFPSPGYSQFILGETLMTELARRGHNVTVIGAYKPREELINYRTILIDGLIKGPQRDLFPRESENILGRIKSIHNLGYMLTEFCLSHPDVQKLLHSNETFDLVILEQFANEALMGFGPHFNVPAILFSSIGLSEWNSHLLGDIRLPSIVPVSKSDFTDHMNFFQRIINSCYNLGDIVYKELISFPQHQEYLDKYFPKKMYLRDIIYNASLMFLNSHVSTTQPTSLTAAVVEIGGFHISSQKLPENIQTYLDGAENGAIMFSMGTNLNSSNLPKSTLDAILRVFSKMKQRVLWKFEDIDVPNKPKNVLLSKWLPQSDILEHPNTVGFITHGGLLSVTEAVLYGVPMVGIPIFGDQRMNVARCVQKGIGIHLPFQKLSEHSLYAALTEILENPNYQKNARRNSNILRDRIVRPLDLAMYWVEYVIRHNGAPHLKNSSLTLYWFQLYLIDVFSFVIFCALIGFYLTKFLYRKIFSINKLQSNKRNKRKKQ